MKTNTGCKPIWPLLFGVVFVATLAFCIFAPLYGFGRHSGARKIMQKRVQAAGGWPTLRRESESLLTNTSFEKFREGGYYWHGTLSSLPDGLSILQPRMIRFDMGTNHPAIVQIKLFGSGKTDWTPYYGLWIVCGAGATNYTPVVSTNKPHPYSINRLSDGVFEVEQQ